jgi:hypothetical protein
MATPAETPDLGIEADGSGRCKRPGCGRPLPASDQGGRPRQFCSKECRIRYYNAQRGQALGSASASGTETTIPRLTQLLAEASRLAVTVSSEVAAVGPGRIAAMLAEAEAARRRAEADAAAADARAADAAAAAEAAWEVADTADASRDAALARAEAAEGEARDLRSRAAAELAGVREAGETALAAAREIASAQAACLVQADAARSLADAAIARAERAEAALDAERAERRVLTDRLTAAVPVQPRGAGTAASA